MSRKKRLLKTFCLVAVILILASLTQREIDRFRQTKGAAGFQIYQELDLASFAGTVLLAGFRGPAVVILWIRSLNLIERHEWFELSALYKLISKLQPNFPSVWVFNSWNLSHNISVHWDSAEDKWRWFKAGIDFAKEGLEKNPDSPDLLFWLGFLYYYRIYRYVDTTHPEHWPYFLRQVEETEGQSAPEMALKYFTRAREVERHGTFAPFALDVHVPHAMVSAAWYALWENRNLEKGLAYMEQALDEWEKLTAKYPEAPILRGYAQEARSNIKWLREPNMAQVLALEDTARDASEKKNFEKAITYMEKATDEWKNLTNKYPETRVLGNHYQAALQKLEDLREIKERAAP